MLLLSKLKKLFALEELRYSWSPTSTIWKDS